MASSSSMLRAMRDAAQRHGGAAALARKVVDVWRSYGTAGVAARVRNRVRQGVAPPPLFDDAALEPSPAERRGAPDGSLGVVAHLHYPDLAPELAAYLAHIPWPFQAFVSTTSERGRAEAVRALRRVPTLSRLDVRVVPNRGRDIAPFLVTFAQEIRSLDYVCHVHGKKSVRTGVEQAAWRRHLHDALLGSEERVRAIFAAFRLDSALGMVHPAPGPFVPYWAHGWLGARHIGEPLVARLGVDVPADCTFDVAAGSMLWARVAALRPLLDLGLRLEDFPPEEGQRDGTLQHAIERAFVHVARAAGYRARVVETGPDRHRFLAANARNAHEVLLAPPIRQRIVEAARQADVVSFDVFDTLLVRAFATPDAVLRLVEDRVARRDGVRGFLARRKAAEEEVRRAKGGRGDAKLREIYAALARREGVADEVAAAWMAMELAAERDVLRPRPEVVRALAEVKAAGKRVVLVSDMYLEEPDVRALLDANGIRGFDAIYLSSETGLRKDRGEIWAELHRRERVAPARLLHVGDNERSDVQLLHDLGAGSPLHVLRPLAGFELVPEGRALLAQGRPRRWQDDLALGLVAGRAVLHLDRDPRAAAEGRLLGDPGRFGYAVLGPLLLELVGWLARRARADGVEALEFVSREGWALKAAWDALARHPRVRRPLPVSRYLLASRRAAGFAAVRQVEDLRALLRSPFEGTVAELLSNRLGLDAGAALPDVAARLGPAVLERRVVLPAGAEEALDALAACEDLLLVQAARERDAYLAYARERLTASPVALVDVGYSGTTQGALMRLLGVPLTGYYAATTARIRDVERLGGRAAACFAERVDGATCEAPAYRYSMILEAVLTSPDGQLLRFERDGAGVKPVFKAPGRSQRAFVELAAIQAGAVELVRDAADAVGDEALDLALDHELVQRPLALVAEGRWRVGPLERLLSVEDDYSGNGEVAVIDLFRRMAAGGSAGRD